MTLGQLDRVAVVASSVTDLRPAWSGLQHVDLISRVVAATLAGSGLRMDDVDFVINSGSDVLDGRSISNCGFLGAMGAHHKEESRVEEDGLWSMTPPLDPGEHASVPHRGRPDRVRLQQPTRPAALAAARPTRRPLPDRPVQNRAGRDVRAGHSRRTGPQRAPPPPPPRG